jgi:hypothetical protein
VPRPTIVEIPPEEQGRMRAELRLARYGYLLALPLLIQVPLHHIPGVIQVQLIQETLWHFVINVVAIGSEEWSVTSQKIAATLRSCVGSEITMAINRVEQIPTEQSGKVKAVISRLRS